MKDKLEEVMKKSEALEEKKAKLIKERDVFVKDNEKLKSCSGWSVEEINKAKEQVKNHIKHIEQEKNR